MYALFNNITDLHSLLQHLPATNTLIHSQLGAEYYSQRIQQLATEQLPEQREQMFAHGHISAYLIDGGRNQFNFCQLLNGTQPPS